MTRTLSLILLVATVLAGPILMPASTSAQTYTFDTSHSQVGFKVRHNVISWVHGRFNSFEGTVTYDPAKPKSLSANVTLQIASVDTENAKRDDHLRSADFFAAEEFPTATFVSKKVTKADKDGTFQLIGDLTIKGVTKEVSMAVEPIAGPIALATPDHRGPIRYAAHARTLLVLGDDAA
ncbi:MAG: hypothetical protein GY882_11005, partial [Actinomycetia bacterium]|nr:hypothetical protein [Actinomycetes bacterium]